MPEISSPEMDSSYYNSGNSAQKSQNKEKSSTSISSSSDVNALFYDLLNLSDSTTSTETENLEKLLKEVQNQKESNSTTQNTTASDNQNNKSVVNNYNNYYQDSSESTKHKAKVLRFNVNGYNILNTCRTIYVSSQNPDGSFLISGDRIYISDGKRCSETFYIYFNSRKTSQDMTKLFVTVSVDQNPANENSFLYLISQNKNLVASKTGNFVTLRNSDNDLAIDLLIDLGDK